MTEPILGLRLIFSGIDEKRMPLPAHLFGDRLSGGVVGKVESLLGGDAQASDGVIVIFGTDKSAAIPILTIR